jgi:transcriptional regulator with XRE-family HTH domain
VVHVIRRAAVHPSAAQWSATVEIGIRIRSIRMQQGRTLDDVAQACDCSKSLLSKIETGKVVPALATLSKIANALGVRISTLLEDGEDHQPAVTPNLIDQPEQFVATDRGYNIYAVAPHFLNKKMQPVLVYGRKGEVLAHSVSHAGEEFIIVLQGEVQAHIGNNQYHLRQGDSIYIQSSYVHGFMPVTDTAVYLDVFVE